MKITRLNERVKSFKDANLNLKPTTIRLSESHYKRLVSYAEKNGIKESSALRLLLEFALDEAFKHHKNIKNNANFNLQNEIESLREEVGSLKRKMEEMWSLVEDCTGEVSKGIDEELDSDKSKGTDEEIDGEHQASTE